MVVPRSSRGWLTNFRSLQVQADYTRLFSVIIMISYVATSIFPSGYECQFEVATSGQLSLFR